MKYTEVMADLLRKREKIDATIHALDALMQDETGIKRKGRPPKNPLARARAIESTVRPKIADPPEQKPETEVAEPSLNPDGTTEMPPGYRHGAKHWKALGPKGQATFFKRSKAMKRRQAEAKRQGKIIGGKQFTRNKKKK